MKVLGNPSELLASDIDRVDAIMLSAFSRMNRIPGKKALQKFVYFLKESGLDLSFKFQWDKWGPFSGELATYVDDLVAEGFLESHPEPVPFGNRLDSAGIQYNFTVSPRTKSLLSAQTISPSEKAKVDRVMKLIQEINTRNLELYASIHFMVRFLTTRGEKARLPESLVELMDEYKRGRFEDSEIKGAYYNLKTLGWL